MKKIGLGLMSIASLLVCFVIFQNCSGFQASSTGSASGLAAIPLSCQGAFSVSMFGQSMTVSMSQTATGLVTMARNGSQIGSGSCVNSKINLAVTGSPSGQCTGTYTVSNGHTAINGTCTSSGSQTPFSGTQQ